MTEASGRSVQELGRVLGFNMVLLGRRFGLPPVGVSWAFSGCPECGSSSPYRTGNRQDPGLVATATDMVRRRRYSRGGRYSKACFGIVQPFGWVKVSRMSAGFDKLKRVETDNRLPHTVTTTRWINVSVMSKFITAVFLLSLIPPARAEDGDDFANNLFSDLAPLLALFGEQVAKQYLSESTGLADNILFAMAPLGVITAVVSAIRVAGHSALKAIIGRGKEGRAQVELELMSSNSPDVGEMWNGQAIVRVLGTPSVFELLYAPDQVARDDVASIGVLDDDSPYFYRVGVVERAASVRQDLPDPSDENYDIELRSLLHNSRDHPPQISDELCPPNISLNARGEPVSNLEKWCMAVIGVATQVSVLCYEAVITYHPAVKAHILVGTWSPSRQAFPCVAVGTVFLNLGMFICAYVIDCASTEHKWTLRDSQSCKVAWVQQGGMVNDQLFEPYIIMGHEGQKVIRTSKRCSSRVLNQLQYLVFLGTIVSVVGFVVQFIGLRGMHWSATIAQLIATALMTIIRSFVRRRMIRIPTVVSVVGGYELDCMARKLGGCAGWKVVPARGTCENQNQRAARVLRIRRRLSELSQWPTPVENLAQSLCTAMERTLDTIYQSNGIYVRKDALQATELLWTLTVLVFDDVLSGQSAPQAHYEKLTFKLTRSQSWGSWEMADVTKRAITAALSLWMLHFREEDRQHQDGSVSSGLGIRNHRFARAFVWPNREELFTLWMGRERAAIRVGNHNDVLQEEEIPPYRVLGKREPSGGAGIPMVGILADAMVENQFAQQIFSDFFSNVVPLIDHISGSTSIYQDDRGGLDIRQLRNSAISQLVNTISGTGIGTEPEILMAILPQLAMHELLPVPLDEPSALVRQARLEYSLRRHRITHQWHSAAAEIMHSVGEHRRMPEYRDKWLTAWRDAQLTARFYKRVLAFASTNKDGHPDTPDPAQQPFLYWLENISEEDLPSLTEDTEQPRIDAQLPSEFLPAATTQIVSKMQQLLAPFAPVPPLPIDPREMVLLRKTMNTTTLEDQVQLLNEAACDGFDTVIEALVDAKVDTRQKERGVENPLVLAALQGHSSVIDILLVQLLFDFPNDYRQFQAGYHPLPLWNAAAAGHLSAVRLLLAHTAQTVTRTNYTEIALTLAAANGHPEVVKELLNAGASANPTYTEGYYNQKTIMVKTTKEGKWKKAKWDSVDLTFKVQSGWRSTEEQFSVGGAEGYIQLVRHLLKEGNPNNLAGPVLVRSPLEAAAEGGHLLVMEYLQRNGAQINTSRPNSMQCWFTALQLAARGGHIAAIRWLLKHGADVNAGPCNWSGRTALQAAAEGGHLQVVNELIDAEAIINVEPSGWSGRTALQAAAGGGQLHVVNRLIDGGTTVNSEVLKRSGRTALQAAAEGGHMAVVSRLLEIGANVNAESSDLAGLTALQAAARGGHLAVTNLLLQHGANVDAGRSAISGRTALQAAAEGGNLDLVDVLLKHGADAVADSASTGRTALQSAAKEGHLSVINRLLGKGANLDGELAMGKLISLEMAAAGGYLAVVDRLLEQEAVVNALDLDRYVRPALRAAARGGHITVVDRLLETGVSSNVEPAQYDIQAAFHAAVEGGHLELIDWLLSNKANPNTRPEEGSGRTALQAAAECGYLDVVERLLAAGADINAGQGVSGRTALQYAAGEGHLEVVELLLRHGADVNAVAAWRGRTALQAAAEGGHRDIVERLLQRGADVNAEPGEYSGATALEAAAEAGYLEIVNRLRRAGAS